MFEFIRPDAFHGQPYSWATNQCGHLCLGLSGQWMLLDLGAGIACFVTFALAYVALEVWQVVRFGGEIPDGFHDVFFFAGGMALAFVTAPTAPDEASVIVYVMAAALVIGAVIRSRA